MKKKVWGVLLVSFFSIVISCSNSSSRLKDGYYTAECDEYDENGWKAFMTICVNNGIISQVEYNAKDIGGFIKSWDMDYMRIMNAASGTYPNEYSRFYASQFIEDQNADSIDVLTGATNSWESFVLLARAVLENARNGVTSVAVVPIQPHTGAETPDG
ncbi:MAG: FMN-binding protein [Spirochaetaceae bacterium]|jgi:major membrane immunogen (membrane-anchored lipoprotein)|nr:FMN-binding protein [Spirochaetaceae bacterium]